MQNLEPKFIIKNIMFLKCFLVVAFIVRLNILVESLVTSLV